MLLAGLVLAAQAVATPSPAPPTPDEMPEPIAHSVPSVYELFAGCNGGYGTFIVHFTVTTAGTVKNVITVRGPYCSAAEQRMIKAVRAWRYKPVRKNGRVVATELTVSIMPGG